MRPKNYCIPERIIKTIIALGLFCLLCYVVVSKVNAYAQTIPEIIVEPNEVKEIKLPEGAKMPIRLKCSVHGIIGKAFIVIETDNGTNVYCARCAKTFVSKVFDLNLPKLEVLK